MWSYTDSMQIVVLGATGPTGLLIVKEALAEGHHVTAFVRTPSKLTIAHERLSACRGDVSEADSVARAVEVKDAVICTVGVPYTFKPVTVYSTAARHVLAAMNQHDVRRFIGITSGGTYPGRDSTTPWFFERVLKPLFHTLYDDMREMERMVMASDRDWTILRPSRLLDKAPTGSPRIGVDKYALQKEATVSRADLARVTVRQLTSTELIGRAAAVSD